MAQAYPSTLPDLVSAWTGAVAARTGSVLVDGAGTLQELSMAALHPSEPPYTQKNPSAGTECCLVPSQMVVDHLESLLAPYVFHSVSDLVLFF